MLDPQLFKNLMVLKNYEGNVEEDFNLNFSISKSEFGADDIVDLVPNGRNTSVTNENRMKYIYLMAKYRLNDQIQEQINMFLIGFRELIPHSYIQMFNEV